MNSKTSAVALNLAENKDALRLYCEYPFFVSVLKWLGKEIDFDAIPQLDTLENFRAYCLPEIKGSLLRLGLLKIENGKVTPVTTNVVLEEIPTCPAIKRLVFENQLSALRRTANQCNVYTNIETPSETSEQSELKNSKFCYVITVSKSKKEPASCSA